MNAIDDELRVVLAREMEGFESLGSVKRLSGGASQETYRIEIVANGDAKSLAMRRAAGGVIRKPDPARPGLDVEAKLMQYAKSIGVPEPEIYYVLIPEDGLGSGFIMEWLEGETLGSRVVKSPELKDIRPKLAHKCGRILAKYIQLIRWTPALLIGSPA